MRIACLVPPLHLPVNEIGHGYHPPLGLLAIAGALVDSGLTVKLLDADAAHAEPAEIRKWLTDLRPEVALVGHSGSMAANPAALQLMREIRVALPKAVIVYGGVYPTYAAEELMSSEPALDFIVCGEGEAATLELILALHNGERSFGDVRGLVWRSECRIVANKPRPPIQDLDQFRVAWELADWRLYENHHQPGRTAIVQFSRGCPHTCTYCGQRLFWKQWRHRKISGFVDELHQLRTQYNVRTVWLADENWACVPELFHALLESIAARNIGIHFFCAMCAEDVVRDAEQISLYRRAGIICVMLGAESFDDRVLARIGKNNPYATTTKAVQLLKQHGILSVVNVMYGLRSETWSTLWSTLLHLRKISPDYFNALHLTPLSWTLEGHQIELANVVQLDQRKWDFRQPVLQPDNFSPKTLALLVKLSEAMFYLRPFRILGDIFARDPVKRRIMRDATIRLARVYLHECFEVLRNDFARPGQALSNPGRLKLLMPGLPTSQERRGARAPALAVAEPDVLQQPGT